MDSDDTQICLQSDAVRFTIMNSGESYILKMYEWYNQDWALVLTFRNCEVEASNKFEMPMSNLGTAKHSIALSSPKVKE